MEGFLKEADEVYHSKSMMKGGEYLSSHALMTFIDCPDAFNKKRLGVIPSKDSSTFKAGRAVHCMVLEGREEYKKRYIFGGPVNPKTGKYYGSNTDTYSKWVTEQEVGGLEVLTDGEDRLCEMIKASTDQHPEIQEALSSGDAECIFRDKYCGFPCQIKVDWFNDDAIYDLKTTADIKWFTSDFFKYRYQNQLSFYQKVFEQATGKKLPVKVIAVEKSEPYRCGVFEIDQSILDRAQFENENAMNELRECMKSGLYPTRYEGIQKIEAR